MGLKEQWSRSEVRDSEETEEEQERRKKKRKTRRKMKGGKTEVSKE
jgi:hypothetical protein